MLTSIFLPREDFFFYYKFFSLCSFFFYISKHSFSSSTILLPIPHNVRFWNTNIPGVMIPWFQYCAGRDMRSACSCDRSPGGTPTTAPPCSRIRNLKSITEIKKSGIRLLQTRQGRCCSCTTVNLFISLAFFSIGRLAFFINNRFIPNKKRNVLKPHLVTYLLKNNLVTPFTIIPKEEPC